MSAKRILYLDPFSGIAGDMLVGALLDLGVDLEILRHELSKLKLAGYRLSAKKVLRKGIAATHFDVGAESEHHSHDHAHHHGHEHEHAHEHEHGHAHGHGHHHHKHEANHRYDADIENTQLNLPNHKAEVPANHEPRAESHEPRAHSHRTFAEIRAMIESSALSSEVKTNSLLAFHLLARAEGRMHGQPTEKVHFHEVGAVDSIVDFVGACVALEALKVDEVRCGPVALGGEGGGYVECQHGTLPVPAFATLELMKGLPIRLCPVNKELTTPTGAALVKALVRPEHFGALPPLKIEKIGYGAGTRNDPAIPIPNVLRAVVGTLETDAAGVPLQAVQPALPGHDESDQIVELQANIDDLGGEVLGYLAERLFAAGALDVFFTPVQMKKSRPATLVTLLAEPKDRDALLEILFRESTTFGVRFQSKHRAKLTRTVQPVRTPWGEVHVKVGLWKAQVVAVHPEYEDCKRVAEQTGIPLQKVIEAAKAAFELDS